MSDVPPFFHLKSLRYVMYAIIENVEMWVNQGLVSGASAISGATANLMSTGNRYDYAKFAVKVGTTRLIVTVTLRPTMFHEGVNVPGECGRIVQDVSVYVPFMDMSFDEAKGEVGIFTDAEIEIVETLEAQLKDIAQPKPESDGLWWADENLYPIRPMMEGEDEAYKPDPKWTVVNGTTGEEVVTEAKALTEIAYPRDVYGEQLPGQRIEPDALRVGMHVQVGTFRADVYVVTQIMRHSDGVEYDSVKEALAANSMRSVIDMFEVEVEPEIDAPQERFSITLQWQVYDQPDITLFPNTFGDWSTRHHASDRMAAGTGISLSVPNVRHFVQLMTEDEYRRPQPILLRAFREHSGAGGDVLDFTVFLITSGTEAKFTDEDRKALDDVVGFGVDKVPENMEDAYTLVAANIESNELNGWQWDVFCHNLISAAQCMFTGHINEAKKPSANAASNKIARVNALNVARATRARVGDILEPHTKNGLGMLPVWWAKTFDSIHSSNGRRQGVGLNVSCHLVGPNTPQSWVFFYVTFTDPFNVKISSSSERDLKVLGYERDREPFPTVVHAKQDLLEMSQPQPAQQGSLYHGYWWAEKETFELFRPVLEGEDARYRPEPSWIVIDPHSYDELPMDYVDSDDPDPMPF